MLSLENWPVKQKLKIAVAAAAAVFVLQHIYVVQKQTWNYNLTMNNGDSMEGLTHYGICDFGDDFPRQSLKCY